MKKFAIHIHLYLTNHASTQLAYENISNLKRNGFSILITSAKPIPDYFYDIIDFFYLDSENQIISENCGVSRPFFWWFSDASFKMNFAIYEKQIHSLAVLRSMIKSSHIAKMVGVDYIIKTEYDDIFGKNSIKKLYDIMEYLSNKQYDFFVYRNEYIDYTDISVHLMFYKPIEFLSVFQSILNENDYSVFKEKMGKGNHCLSLEEFLYRGISNSKYNTHYENGFNMQSEFEDSHFNTKQSSYGIGGTISDVMYIVDSNKVRNTESVCLVSVLTDEVSSNKVYFDIYNNLFSLDRTIEVDMCNTKWYYQIIDNCRNISRIGIRYNNDGYHRVIGVNAYHDGIVLINELNTNEVPFSEIIYT